MSRKRHRKVHYHTPPEKAAKIQRRGTFYAATVGAVGVILGAILGFSAQDALKESQNISARGSRFNAAIAHISSIGEAQAQEVVSKIKPAGGLISLQQLAKEDPEGYKEPALAISTLYIISNTIPIKVYSMARENSPGEGPFFLGMPVSQDVQRALAVIGDPQIAGVGGSFPVTIEGRYLEGAILANAMLRGSSFSYSAFVKADLRGADLSEAKLEHTSWSGAELQGANLRGANLQYADLRGAVLAGARLEGADLSYAKVEPGLFVGAVWDDRTTFPRNFKPGVKKEPTFEEAIQRLVEDAGKAKSAGGDSTQSAQ